MSLDIKNSNFTSLSQPIYMGSHKLDAIYMGNKKIYPMADGVWRMFRWSQAPTGYYHEYFVPCYIDSANMWSDGINYYCSMPKSGDWIPGESNARNGRSHYILNKSNMSWVDAGITIIPTEEEQEWIDEGPDEDGYIYSPYIEPPGIYVVNGEVYCFGYAALRKFNRSSRTWYPYEFDNKPFEESYANVFVIDGSAYIFDYDSGGFYKLISNSWEFIGSMGLTEYELKHGYLTWSNYSRGTKRNKYLCLSRSGDVWKVFDKSTETWVTVNWTFSKDNKHNPEYINLPENLYEINGVLHYFDPDVQGMHDYTYGYTLNEETNTWYEYEIPFDDNVPQYIRNDFAHASSDELIIWTDGVNYYRSIATEGSSEYQWLPITYCQIMLS